jgi:hypothetical protein
MDVPVTPASDGPTKGQMIKYVLNNYRPSDSTFLDRLMRYTAHYNRFRLERVGDGHRRVVCCPHDGDPDAQNIWYDDEKIVHAYFRRTILKDLKQMLRDAAGAPGIDDVCRSKSDSSQKDDDGDDDDEPDIERYELIGEGDTVSRLVGRTLLTSLQLEPAIPDIELDSKKHLFSFADVVVESTGLDDAGNGGVSPLVVRKRRMDDNIRMVSPVRLGGYDGMNNEILKESDIEDMAKIESILSQCIVNKSVREFRLAMVANLHFRYDLYEQLKLVLYTVSGPDCGKTMVDLVEDAVYAPYSEFVTQKGSGAGLSERATMNAKARMHKIMEARQTPALLTLIKDVYASMAMSKTRAFTDDKLSGGAPGMDGVTKLGMTGNVEDMIPCPGAHMLDKILLIMEFDKDGNRILGKFVNGEVPADKKGTYFSKDSAKGDIVRSARMKTAAARLLLKICQTATFDPKKEPDAIVGLKEYWSRVQGLDSAVFSSMVETNGYEVLPAPNDRSIGMTSHQRVELPPVLSHPFKTDDEAIAHYVRMVSSAIDFDASGHVVKLADIACSIKEICTPFEWKAMGGVAEMKGFDRSELAKKIHESFDEVSPTPMFRGNGGTHRYKGRSERVHGWHVFNAYLPDITISRSSEGEGPSSSSVPGNVHTSVTVTGHKRPRLDDA